MTRALHELIDTSREVDTGREIDEREARILEELSEQFKATAGQIAQEQDATPEDVKDITEARKVLTERLGHIATSELVEMMDAAVASDSPQLTQEALDALDERFPTKDISTPGLLRANIRSRLDYKKAMELAKQNGTRVSEEMVNAAGLNDMDYDVSFDDTIVTSNWSVKEQHDELTDERDQRDLKMLRELENKRLQELVRREEEREKLEAIGQEDNKNFDDAVKYDPFADDDEDEAA